MSSFTDIFIRRPVLASVVSLLILLIGVQAGFKLQIRQYPELSQTTITITTTYPGANADLIKGFITTPLEQAVASTEGIDTLVASSQQNVSTITLNMRLNASPDRAVADVLSKIQQVKTQLPRDAQDPVVVKQTGQGYALLYMSFNSEVLTAAQITDYITRVVQPRLQTIDGVANAQILGGQTFAMRIWLDPTKMAARGVTPVDVRNALAANNFTSAAGQIKNDYTQTSINALTSLDSATAFANLVVQARGDALVRLGDIARVELGPESADSSSVFDGLKAVFVGIYATPTANPLTVIDLVRKATPDIQAQLPPGMKAAIAYDATDFIRASIWEVAKTLLEAAGIVVVVIFLFLGNLRATLVPIVTIPLSLIGVMIALLAMNYSINLLTLLAFVLAIGLVVDDAIVVVENIWRHIEEGLSPRDAALVGAREIAGPVISMTITLAAVYAPIGFVSGLTGALFREFAFTLAGSVIVSGIIALTLSPMMCSVFLKSADEGRFAKLVNRVFGATTRWYGRKLDRSLDYKPVTLMFAVTILGLVGFLYMNTAKELAPEEDQGIVFALLKAPKYANIDYLDFYGEKLDHVFASFPETDLRFALNGINGPQNGIAGMLLHAWDERKRSSIKLKPLVQAELSKIEGVQAFAFNLPALPGGPGGLPVQMVINSTADFRAVYEQMEKLKAAARKSGLFIVSDSDLAFNQPTVRVAVDRSKAQDLGVNMQQLGNTLATLLGGNYINRFNLEGRSYQVIPQVPRSNRLTPESLGGYYVGTTSGQQVPLSTLVSIETGTDPNALTHYNQLNSATFQAVPMPGVTVGQAVDFLEGEAKKMPAGFSHDYLADSRQYVQEGNQLAITFGFALIIIFLVLAAQFESLRDPLVIMISVPMAIVGALIPLFFGVATMNIYTQVGLLTLVGLITKHGILMVEFANKLQETEGLDKHTAIKEAAAIRLRPILMTTAAMVIGVLPLLLANGAGAKSRFDIGIIIAAGMAIGTMFTLFITPAVYSYVARDRRRFVAEAHAHDEELAHDGDAVHPAQVVTAPANDQDKSDAPKKRKKNRDDMAEAAE